MHPAAYEYVAGAVQRHNLRNPSLRIVELGSHDVNGSVRSLFGLAHYHGIDIQPGRGVDEVADAGEWQGRHAYDIAVSTETLEHAPNPAAVIRAAWRALKPGGLLVATMAAPERTPHNTNGDPLTDPDEHYQGISENDLRVWLRRGWEILDMRHDAGAGDIYLTARAR